MIKNRVTHATQGTCGLPDNSRYERKFCIHDLDEHEVELIVNLHPAIFREVYRPRSVNNIYFDSPNLDCYWDNVEGLPRRTKVRIRWYGELFGVTERPALELKTKDGLLGNKELFPLHPFEVGSQCDFRSAIDFTDPPGIPEGIESMVKGLRPVFLSQYQRIYYQSPCGDYRITLDSDMVFYGLARYAEKFLQKVAVPGDIILELKYEPQFDVEAKRITTVFPFRSTKFSKYVKGVESVIFAESV